MLGEISLVIMPPSNQQITVTCLMIAIFVTCSFCLEPPCNSHSWWNFKQNQCINCTQCEDQFIVLRPCQLHQDTVCGTIYDLEIDWMLLKRPKSYQRQRENEIETVGTEISWDWQLTSLVLAVLACLLFFVAAGYASLQQMKQWRRMEQRLNKDVEELSVKLMSRLAEARNIENGTFIIENPIRDYYARPVEVQCIKLEQLLEKEPIKSLTQGNLYIEDAGSKG